jgi:thiamine-phosphate pyrophosphorylase
VLSDETLYKEIRKIRHDTDKILRDKYPELIAQRDTNSDSGKTIPETIKKELPEIIIANFKRVQESLRVLEEYSKPLFPPASPQFKTQRFAIYKSEKTLMTTHKIKDKFTQSEQ